jgi:hypothetical protein
LLLVALSVSLRETSLQEIHRPAERLEWRIEIVHERRGGSTQGLGLHRVSQDGFERQLYRFA